MNGPGPQLLVLASAMPVVVGLFLGVNAQVRNDCPRVRSDVKAMWVLPRYAGAPMAPACDGR